jgi:anti-sigma factor ChrR (cupin superfamily)
MSSARKNKTASLHELVSRYALNDLDTHDKQSFEKHLSEGCDDCQEELRSLHQLTAIIGAAVAVDPPPQLRERLISRLARTPRTPGLAYNEGGLLIARSQEIAWRNVAPGITYKPLHRDKARNSDTLLIRMEAGARYPSHRHTQVEELFVLSGDLRVEDQVMHAGDYCRADLGSVHNQSFTEGGCVFLLMASPDNQLLA